MSPTRSSAATKCISEVPGLAKQMSTPALANVLTKLSAPFICSFLAYAPVDMRTPPILVLAKPSCRRVWAATPISSNAKHPQCKYKATKRLSSTVDRKVSKCLPTVRSLLLQVPLLVVFGLLKQNLRG